MKEMIVIDTDILIDVGRNAAHAVDFLMTAESEFSPAISIITYMELMAGCRNKTELRVLERFVLRFSVLKLSAEISDIALDLLRKYRSSHGLAIPDALIAATAVANEKPFATKNQRHFQFIDELRLLKYS